MSSEDDREDQQYGPSSRGPIRRRVYMILSVLPFLYITGSGLLLYAKWDRIPDRIPIHYDLSGNVDGWAAKGFFGVYGLLIVGLVIAAVMVVLSIFAMTHSSKHTDPAEKMLYEQTRAKGTIILLASIHWIALYLCYLSVCRALVPDLVGYPFIVLIGGLVVLSPIFVAIYLAVRPKAAPRAEAGKAATGRPGDLAPEWKFGLFYWNPDDPSVFVEHRYGVGVTLNLGRPLSWVLLSVLALIVVGSIVLVVVVG